MHLDQAFDVVEPVREQEGMPSLRFPIFEPDFHALPLNHDGRGTFSEHLTEPEERGKVQILDTRLELEWLLLRIVEETENLSEDLSIC